MSAYGPSRAAHVYCAPSPTHGRGVFAARDLAAGEVVEECPVIVIPDEQRQFLDQTDAYNYYYEWEHGAAAIALGMGSLYNHSFSPNAAFDVDFAAETIRVVAVEPVVAGTEIMFDYTGGSGDPSQLWFEPDQ